MKIWIDNHDLTGAIDYTEFLDANHPLKILRSLNQPTKLFAAVVGEVGTFATPKAGSKICVAREDGSEWFTGTIESAPQQHFVGNGMRGTVVSITFAAKTEELGLDRAPLEKSASIAEERSSDILMRWTQSAGAPTLDLTDVCDVGKAKAFTLSDGERWSGAAARMASACRAAYTAEGGKVSLLPIGMRTFELSEADPKFIPENLELEQTSRAVFDWTVVGELGPGAYVKDYFVGDGHTLRFPMSMQPFLRPTVTWIEEEYATPLSAVKWEIINPSMVFVSGGKLVVNGGAKAALAVIEQLELGGCIVLEHGALVLASASEGIVGGLYADALQNCVAGFGLRSSGGSTTIQPIVQGAAAGTAVPVIYGHRYELTTRLYGSEVFRIAQAYRHSAGEETKEPNSADVRFVMEVRDLDSGLGVPTATVLYEGVVANAPALVKYAVVNATSTDATISYTRVRKMPTVEVRTTSASDGATRSRIVGLISDGAECAITTGPAAYFYAPYKPADGDQIVVRYRSAERTAARVYQENIDPSAAVEIVRVQSPVARTVDDCRNAASALLRDSTTASFGGTYSTWTDLLTEGEPKPGDALHVHAPSRGVDFIGVVREVETEIVDGKNDRAACRVRFAEEGAEPIGISYENFRGALEKPVASCEIGHLNSMPALAGAEVLEITSTLVQIDAGADLPAGGGIEVRREGDFGWGEGNDRNLVGRFSTRTFAVPRSTRGEDYYVRMYDSESPRNYSSITTLLHVDVKDDAI